MDALALTIAAALLVMGAAAIGVRERRRGASAILVGLLLPAIAYPAGIGASAYAASAATALAPLVAPVVAAGVVRRNTVAIWLSLVAGVVAGPARTALYDPFYDPTCFIGCVSNPWAVAHLGAPTHEALWWAAFAVAATLTLAAVQGPNRVALAVLASASWLLALWRDDMLLPSTIGGLVALSVTGVAVARAIEARARMTELARALELAGDVTYALATATRDPRLTVSYVLEGGAEVSPDGSPVATDPTNVRVIDLVGPDGVVARVHHSTEAMDASRLANAVRGPGSLALENGRLAAHVRRESAELEASRRRLVAHADAERQRLERDLHDGAQQHVLALGLALRTALDEAWDDATRDVLHRSLATTHKVLDELREMSHGFYPASLEQTGLHHAMDGVIDRAQVPVEVGAVPVDRLPAPIERAIYLLTARAVLAARNPVTIAVRRQRDVVTVVVVGAPAPDDVLTDVFAVLGGRLVVSGRGAGLVIQAVLPIEPAQEDV